MPKLYVAPSGINGMGLFASQAIQKGERIACVYGPIRVVRDFSHLAPQEYLESWDWIGVGRYSWIDTKNSLFRFINHSCQPNAAIVTTRTVRARIDISRGTEITMDYSLTEAGQDWSIECTCGTKTCRKLILPINMLPDEVYLSHLPYITKRFRKVYASLKRLERVI